jgi:hypothetical protein
MMIDFLCEIGYDKNRYVLWDNKINAGKERFGLWEIMY